MLQELNIPAHYLELGYASDVRQSMIALVPDIVCFVPRELRTLVLDYVLGTKQGFPNAISHYTQSIKALDMNMQKQLFPRFLTWIAFHLELCESQKFFEQYQVQCALFSSEQNKQYWDKALERNGHGNITFLTF